MSEELLPLKWHNAQRRVRDLVPLSRVARGEAPDGPGRVLFKGSGMAWQDLVVAEAVLDAQR